MVRPERDSSDLEGTLFANVDDRYLAIYLVTPDLHPSIQLAAEAHQLTGHTPLFHVVVLQSSPRESEQASKYCQQVRL